MPPRLPITDPWLKRWLYGQFNATPADNTAARKAPDRLGVSARSQFRRGLPLPELEQPREPGAPRRNAAHDLGVAADFTPVVSELKAAAQGGYLAALGNPKTGIALAGAGLIPGGIRAARAARAAKTVEHAIPGAADRFAILTGENAGGRSMTAAENATRNEALVAELRKRGFEPVPVKGKYKDPTTGEVLEENSFHVPGMSEREAKLVGKRFGQNGIITQRGYHDMASNKFFPSRGIGEAADLPFTELPNGKKFALDIDWENGVDPRINALPVPKNANPEAMRLVDELRGSMPNAPAPLRRVKNVDKERAQQMASAYERLPKSDPQAKGAYDQLNTEVAQQLKSIQDAGYKIEYVDGDPYKNSAELFADLRENRRMKVLKTNDSSQHPYMTRDQNDAFRAVHDFIAHGGGGNQFGAVGEENAYRIHASTLSPEAQRALATETRGQNSWVNFGPNGHKPVGERPFAEQKAALWPTEMLGEYNAFPNGAKRPSSSLRGALGTQSEGDLDALLQSIAPRVKPPVDEAAARTAAARSTPFPEIAQRGPLPSPQVIAERDARHAQAMASGRNAPRIAGDSLTGRIAGAAIRLPDGSIHTGHSHWPAIEAAMASGKLPDATHPDFERLLRNSDEGFVDDAGKFLTRDQTAKRMRSLGNKGFGKRSRAAFGTSATSEEVREAQGGYAAAVQAPRDMPEAAPRAQARATRRANAEAKMDAWLAERTKAPDVVGDSVVSKAVQAPNALEWGTTKQPPNDWSRLMSGDRLGPQQTVPLNTLRPMEKTDEAQVQRFMDQFREDPSAVPPIVVDADVFDVVDGHHRLEAAKRLGMKDVPVHVYGNGGKPIEPPSLAKPIEAPNVITSERWKPTERGVFDRSAPSLQGTAPIDPRLAVPTPKRAEVSPFIEAVANSKTVRQGLERDAQKGLPQGGDSWYELGPIKADLDERAGKDGALSFNDFVNLGSAASIQNPTSREPNTMSVMLYAMKNGISYEDAVKQMQATMGNNVKPWLSPTHTGAGEQAMASGIVAPTNPMSANWKLPWYAHGKLGGAPNAGAALDTHERKRVMQLAMDNKRLAKIARETGAVEQAAGNKGLVPLRNALDYDAVSELYRSGARDLGLPSPQAFQAGRWIGGGEHTGLKSAPQGDYVQTIEDALAYTARARGMGEQPHELRNLWGNIVSGKDFFAPHWGNGGFPIY